MPSSRQTRAMLLGTVLMGLPLALQAQTVGEPEMEDLGVLPADNPRSLAIAASEDGSVVFGRSDNGGSDPRVFRWTDDGGMQDLGTLRSDNTGRAFMIDPNWVSHGRIKLDGTVIVGSADADGGFPRAFRWTEEGGMVDLGVLTSDGFGDSSATTMTSDGTVIGGRSWADTNDYQAVLWRFGPDAGTAAAGFETLALGTLRDDNSGYSEVSLLSQDGSVAAGASVFDSSASRHGYRWTEDDGMVDLGTLRSDNSGASNVEDMSSDGNFLVGAAQTDGGNSSNAVLWRFGAAEPSATGGQLPVFETVDLGNLGGTGGARGEQVTDDGRVVIGGSSTSGNWHAFRWTEADGMVDLGSLGAGAQGYSTAYDMSDDGNIIIGSAHNLSSDRRAVVWRFDDAVTQTDAPSVGGDFEVTDLGTLRADNSGGAYAQYVSGDGSVVVGQAATEDRDRVFRWTEETGMVDLGTLRADNTGFSYAYSMTDDGSVIVGSADTDDGTTRAFAWRGAMVDLANTQATAREAARGMAAASAEYNAIAMRQLDRELDLPERDADGGTVSTQGGASARLPMVLSFGARVSRNADVGSYGRADVTGALGLGGGYVLGGFVEVANEQKTYGAVTLSGQHIAGGLSVRYRDNADFTGLTWRVASQFGAGDSTIERGALLPGTFAGQGEADHRSAALSAELGWGHPVAGGVVIPFARLAVARTERDAYTETTATAFPLSFDSHRETVSTLTLGLDSRFAVGAAGTLRLSAGVSHDINRDQNPLTGTSAIPGMATFSVAAPAVVNETRGFGFVSYRHELSAAQAVTTSFGMEQQAWTGKPSANLRIGYEMRF